MEVTSANRYSSLITISIIDDDVVIMCPSDKIGRDNRGIKGVRFSKKVLGEPVSDYWLPDLMGNETNKGM